MREKDSYNIQENNIDDNEFINPMRAACSPEFSDGCIFCDEEVGYIIISKFVY